MQFLMGMVEFLQRLVAKLLQLGNSPFPFLKISSIREVLCQLIPMRHLCRVAAQIVWHQNLDLFLPQYVAKLPSECELTRALPEKLISSLPSIEELEAELGGK